MAELHSLGIRLEARDDRLRYSPRNVPAELLAEMKRYKAELMAILNGCYKGDHGKSDNNVRDGMGCKHNDPTAWKHCDGRAFCSSCHKYMGRLR